MQSYSADPALHESDTIYINTDYYGFNMFLSNDDARVSYGGQSLPPLLTFVSCVFKSDLPENGGGVVINYGYPKYLLSRCPMDRINDLDLKIPPVISSRQPVLDSIQASGHTTTNEYRPINDTYRLATIRHQTILKYNSRLRNVPKGEVLFMVGTDMDMNDDIDKYITEVGYVLDRKDTTLLPRYLIFEFPTPIIAKR